LNSKRFIITCLGFILIATAIFAIEKHSSTILPTDIIKYDNINLSQFKNGNDIFITPKELNAKLNYKNLVILDASHPKVYSKGHIPGAVSIGFKGLSNCNGKPGDKKWGTVLDKARLTKKLESLGITNDSFVVAYSDIFKGPGAGGRAVWQMKMAGLKNVRLLYGGLKVWKRSGYKLSKETVKPVPANGLVLQDYNETYRSEQKYIFENLKSLKLVDVRSFKEFTGEDTHRGEARGGHIKGSKWLEWKDLLNEDSTPRSPKQIKRLLAEKGIMPMDDFILY